MPRAPRTSASRTLALPTALTCLLLLLTACGSQRAATQSAGTPTCGPSAPNSAASSAGSTISAPAADPSGQAMDGVRIVGAAGCLAFAVTNDEPENATYTITFELMSSAGGALSSAKQTVPSVKPGQTVQRPVALGELPTGIGSGAGSGGQTRVRIVTVRDVPTAEAPSVAGPCPASGVRVFIDNGDAAMGLRVVGVQLQNCGTQAYRLNGYPQLQLLDQGHKPVDSVKILHGGDAVATGTGTDGKPQQLVLKPGESAHAGLVWRNTTGQGSDPVNAPYVRVVPKPGAAPVMVTPELDLGTTGKLAVGPWQKG
ncbi:DUF4232 domain-containing protein [Streptacidiphilus sp. PAMC 29251]